jgi:hypothetical protein
MPNLLEEKSVAVTKGRDGRGRFVKGVSHIPNPTGVNGYTFLKKLESALEDEAKRKGFKNFAEVVAQRCLQYETVLIAVLKKICPDQIAHSGEVKTNSAIVLVIPPERVEEYNNRLKGLINARN